MGIADRDYYSADPGRGGAYRGNRGGGGTGGMGGRNGMGSFRFVSANTWIIIINVAVFALDRLLYNAGYGGSFATVGKTVQTAPMLEAWGHFSTYLGFWPSLEVWRLVTFQFLHANFMHLFFNMFGLFIFGSIVEQHLGRRKYVAYYLVCGIFGGLGYLLLNFLEANMGINVPGAFGNPSTPLIGASAGVFGVIIACAFVMPDQRIMLIFPPIPMKMKYMAYGYVAIAAYNLLRGSANAGGEAAHLGGAIAGFFFIRNSHLLRDFFDIFDDSRKPRGRSATSRSKKPRSSSRNRGTAPIAKIGSKGRAPPKRADDRELDRILAKVSDVGMDALTPTEQAFLKQESARRTSGGSGASGG